MAPFTNESILTEQVDFLTVSLTRARAVALLSELSEAFRSKSFQKRLGKLISKGSGAAISGPIRHVEGRQALVFTVQRDVLLRHGFSVDEDGVIAMKTALRAHHSDPKIAELSGEVRLQLRIPQIDPQKTAYPCPFQDELSFLPSLEVPDTAEDPSPVASPSPSPTLLTSRAVRAKPKMTVMTIDVTNPETKQKMVIAVPRPAGGCPTVADVKSAIFTHLGEGGVAKGSVDPSAFQIVIINGGGAYGIRSDREVVRIDRVSALGFNIAAAGA